MPVPGGHDENLIETAAVTKIYEPPPRWLRPLVRSAAQAPVVALDNASVTIRPGELVGLVGPNGAGKTTLIKILTTLLEPTSGSATVCGRDVRTDPAAVRSCLGVVLADDRGLYWRLSGRKNLEFFGVLSGLTKQAATARASELLDEVGLTEHDKLVFGYSTGMRARLALAIARIGSPRALVLDEPTRSLDPAASQEVLAMLRTFADGGGGVLLSSHRIAELVDVCDRVVVLNQGSVQFDGPPGTLATDTSHQTRALLDLLSEPARE